MTDPIVRLEVDPGYGVVPLPVDLTAHTSDDGMIVSYDWDLGDGTLLQTTTPTILHWYNTVGTYTVSVTVTDDSGATAAWSETVDATPDGVIVVTPEEGDIGYVRSGLPFDNFFGDDDVYAGYFNSFDYHGAALPGETVVEETWVSGFRGARSVRCTRFAKEDGTRLVSATTHWAYLDAKTLRPRRVDRAVLDKFPVFQDR